MSSNETDLKTRRQREEKRLRDLVERRPKSDEGFSFSGVLLSDAIEKCCHSFGLITPLEKKNLKPANYKLRIGDEYAIRGKIHSLPDTPGNEIKIAPFEVAIIKTLETINMPRFLIGRWNIQVSKAYKGLLWVGGPQVDAGYVGHLFCPIYNLSDKPVTLHYDEAIAVIDFEGTTEFHENLSKKYDTLPERILFQDYEPESLESALATQAENEIKTFRARLVELSSRMDLFTAIILALLGILFAAGTAFLAEPSHPHWWEPSVFWICVIAIALSGWAVLRARSTVGARDSSDGDRNWQIILWIVLCGLLAISLTWQWRLQNQINELKDGVPKSSMNTNQGNQIPKAETPVATNSSKE